MTYRKKKSVPLMILIACVCTIAGSFIWILLTPILPVELSRSVELGSTQSPWNLDLSFIKLSLGLLLRFNLGTILGLLCAGLLIYRIWKA